MPDEPRPLDRPGPPARRFTVRDAMILVAAAAVGFMGYRASDATMTEQGYSRGDLFDVMALAMLGGPGLAALTAGLVVARLLPPRPTRAELFRQPGFAAACVALAMTAWRFLFVLLWDWLDPFDDWFLIMEWSEAVQEASLGIPVAWSVLALAGCLKAERGWIDRASRAVAVLWVLAGLASRLVPPIQFALFGMP